MSHTLSELTSFRVGGPAASFVDVRSSQDLIDAVTSADRNGVEVLVVAGGSNLLVSDEGFGGTVVLIRSHGFQVVDESACAGVSVRVEAGQNWDQFVAHCVANNWVGVEALSGIPGAVGSTPIQNVGAYGQEVAQTIASVRTWDRVEQAQKTFSASECDFSYRHSRFKAEPARYLVLDVTFQLKHGTLSAPVRYAELARTLGVEVGERAPLAAVRETVLGLRAGKGMVLDPADHDTWSAGSFFTNPIVDADFELPEGAPAFPAEEGKKTSAAWLIEHAGFGKGYGMPGPAALSTKHTLALTNRGDATSADLVELARTVRDGVQAKFGIRLVNEPVLVGLTL